MEAFKPALSLPSHFQPVRASCKQKGRSKSACGLACLGYQEALHWPCAEIRRPEQMGKIHMEKPLKVLTANVEKLFLLAL